MTEKIKNIYKNRFSPLFKNENYDGAFELLDENSNMERYLSNEEKRIMDSYKSALNVTCNFLDEINNRAEDLINQFKRHRLEMKYTKFEWEHRN